MLLYKHGALARIIHTTNRSSNRETPRSLHESESSDGCDANGGHESTSSFNAAARRAGKSDVPCSHIRSCRFPIHQRMDSYTRVLDLTEKSGRGA